MADLAFCAHYPFSSQAKSLVASQGVELTSSILERAEKRVTDAVLTGKIRKVAELSDAMNEELSAYAGARMIVSCANNRYLISRYAVAEAKRASDYLSSDDSGRPEYVEEVAEGFGITFERQGKEFLVPVAHYLAYTPRSVDYKLTNRKLSGGKVTVGRHERIRMLEEAVRKKIEDALPIRAEFPPDVKAAGARVLALLPKIEAAVVKVGAENYPPCIKRLLEEVSLNINLPHTARVALGIYLIKAGLPNAKIVDIFRSAPDFSERTTSYQVEYLRAHNYSMPSCATMDSYGICVADCRCGTPLNFKNEIHGRRLRRLEEEMKK